MAETLDILIADDEAGMRMGVARALRGFTVQVNGVNGEVQIQTRQAESGEQALEMVQEKVPDILLLDHKLPGISGLDVLERLDQDQQDILTVMITAYATLETAVSATKRGAYDFLAKPFTPMELKATVRKAVEHLILSRQARKLAQERRQVRFQFISVLAHELKAPLAAVEGYLKIIRDRSLGEEDFTQYDHMLDRSMIRIDGMRKLILDLLDLTRIESGKKSRELQHIDLREIAKASIETVEPDAVNRDIRIRLNADMPVMMDADRGEVEIILNNLISNAVKYNREGGSVDVKLAAKDKILTVSVSDTGIGMSSEESEKLFADFVRIKNSKTKGIMGSGLGLSIVKKLASLYGGDVTVKSTPDVGSTFTVVLKQHSQPANQTNET